MIVTTTEKLKKREPVEWALDYIKESLAFLMDSEIDQNYKLEIIYTSGKDLALSYRDMIAKGTVGQEGLLIAVGLPAANLSVLRLLVKCTPCPAQQKINSIQKILFYYASNLRYIETFLAGMNTVPSSSTVSLPFIMETLKMARERGLNTGLLEMNKYPLLLCSLPYEEKAPACYLNSFHTVILFANDYSTFLKRHIILHEIGHILFNLRKNHFKSKKAFVYLISLLEKKCSDSKITSLHNYRKKFMEELCADLFATYLLYPEMKKENIDSSQLVFCEKLSAAVRLYLHSLNS
ncbi:hypothetical protein [Candidatus Contubernalis alkaliaceticus]|uniref:hypothetical protein n=1 Tax=Candidatus Contubernalis alkaliaceticus TaxID=338645 RepID=UPI001F4C4C57|nr:hypothetical protein [Candidatus Contubernalis alkalaceticus]UNC90783.1 hypothetical protein HUE98_00990 [Candidatus Contubernalis alkalaceticus]